MSEQEDKYEYFPRNPIIAVIIGIAICLISAFIALKCN